MSILGISQVHQKTIRELQAKIDALEAELKSSKLMYLSLGSEKSYWKDMTVDQKTSIKYLEAKGKKLARLERIAIKWHTNNGRFENQLYAAIEEIMFEVIE